MPPSDLKQRFQEFCLSIAPEESVMLIHHTDADGLSAGVLTARGLAQVTGRNPDFIVPYDYGSSAADAIFLDAVKAKQPDRIVVVDIGIDANTEMLDALSGACKKLLIIDHHTLMREKNAENVTLIKAERISMMPPSGYANAKLCYDLFSEITDLSPFSWVACIGITGDMAGKQWPEFCTKALARAKSSQQEIDRIVQIINSVEILAFEKLGELRDALYACRFPRDLFASPLAAYREQYAALIAEWKQRFDREHEEYAEQELWVFTILTPQKIKSPLANRVSREHPGITILILQEFSGKSLGFSMRRQDGKVNAHEALQTAIRGIPDARAGGHAPAAAGTIPVKYREQFMRNLRAELTRKKSGKK